MRKEGLKSPLVYVYTSELFKKINLEAWVVTFFDILGSNNPSIDTYTHIFMPQGEEDDHGYLFSSTRGVNLVQFCYFIQPRVSWHWITITLKSPLNQFRNLNVICGYKDCIIAVDVGDRLVCPLNQQLRLFLVFPSTGVSDTWNRPGCLTLYGDSTRRPTCPKHIPS